MPIYVPYDGILSPDRIPSYNISEIRIIKGAPSTIYGPNALGGVINIITAKPAKPFEMRLRFNNNQVNTLNDDLYLGLNKNNFYFTLNQSFSKSHGFNMSHDFESDLNENGGIRDNSAFHNTNIGGMLGYSSNDNQDYRLRYSFLSSPWDVPPEVGINKPRYWRFKKWRKNTFVLSAKQGTLKDHLIFNGNFYYDKYYNLLDSYDNDSYTSQLMKYAFHSIYDDYTIGFNFIPEIKISKQLKLKPIFLYKRDLHRQIPDYNEPKETYKASTASLGGEIIFTPSEKLNLEASISTDRHNPLYNNANCLREPLWALNVQGAASFLLNQDNSIYMNMGRKTRFPTLKELYSGYIGRNIPNPDLKEESAFSYEFGYKNRFKDYTEFDICFYRSHLNNLILDVPISPRLSQLQNISKAVYTGIDINFKTNIIKDKIEFKSGYSFLYTQNKAENRINNYIPFAPKHKFYTGLTFNLPLDILAEINLMYVNPVLYQDNFDLQWKKLGGYPVMNLNIKKNILERYDLFVSIQNMLDKNYETEARFPMPGISIVMGFKMET